MSIKKLDVNDYYFHSIICGWENSFYTLKGILEKKEIESPKLLGIDKRFGCHDKDDICLSCNTDSKNMKRYESSFELYLPRTLTLIIDKEFSKEHLVIKPKTITTKELFSNHKYIDKHYTNIYDEYRTKESISINYIKGISIPYNNFVNDPIAFMMFACEDILMDYYTSGLDPIIVKQILDLKNDNLSKIERKRMLDNYLLKISELLKYSDTNIPIYNYENNKKLILM